MFFVWSQRRINVKLAWWGPIDSGKTTTIHALADQIRRRSDTPDQPERPGRATVGMRRNGQPVEVDEPHRRLTTYFCHPPGDIGQFLGYPVHYQCKTAEQPLDQNDARQGVFDGVTGVVLVADAARSRQRANARALAELVDHLGARHGIDPGATSARVDQLFGPDGPARLVVQVNRGDVDDAVDPQGVRRGLMLPDWVPAVGTVATAADTAAVFETFETLARSLTPRLEAAHQRGRIP